MLKLFQNQGKVLRWIMICILMLIAASMIITLVPNVFGPSGLTGEDVLADVNGQTVTLGDVETELRQYRAQNIPAASLSMMAGNVIETLITNRVLFSEAQALNLVPTDDELAQWLREQLPEVLFPGGEYIGAAAYAGFIRQQFSRTVQEFEREILYNIAIEQRLRRMVTDHVQVTEEEINQEFHQRNDSVRIEWAMVEAESMRSEVRPTQEQLREYFDSNKIRYRMPELRPLRLITVNPDTVQMETNISDMEIEMYYNQNQYRFENPARVKVRHILFSTMDKSEEETATALAKAEEVLEQLKSGSDFVELAAKYSEDPGNSQTGGDLGWVTRGMMDPAFEQASFDLPAGELSAAPVNSEFGYHLIRVDEQENRSVKPLSEVHDIIRDDLGAERTQNARYDLMENSLETTRQYGMDLASAARQMDLPFQEFEPFSRSNLPTALPKSSALVSAVFEQPGGEIFSVNQDETLYIGVVTEAVPSRESEYEEVSTVVERDYIETESANLARQKAEEVAQSARDNSNNLAATARPARLEVTTTDYLKRDAEVEGLGAISLLGEEAFRQADGTLQGPVAAGNRWILFRSLELRSADEAVLPLESKTLRAELLAQKRNELFNYYRQQKLREYMEKGLLNRNSNRIQSYLQSLQNLI